MRASGTPAARAVYDTNTDARRVTMCSRLALPEQPRRATYTHLPSSRARRHAHAARGRSVCVAWRGGHAAHPRRSRPPYRRHGGTGAPATLRPLDTHAARAAVAPPITLPLTGRRRRGRCCCHRRQAPPPRVIATADEWKRPAHNTTKRNDDRGGRSARVLGIPARTAGRGRGAAGDPVTGGRAPPRLAASGGARAGAHAHGASIPSPGGQMATLPPEWRWRTRRGRGGGHPPTTTTSAAASTAVV